MRHGILLRLLEQIPAEGLTSRPIAGMRTPVELVVHMYASARQMAESVRTGTLPAFDEAAAAAAITTPKQLLAFVRTFGLEPVMLWDFDHNAPEFRPEAAAKA